MRDLFSISIPFRLRSKLLRAGLTIAEDLRETTVESLSTCAHISREEASAVILLVEQNGIDSPIGRSRQLSAHQLLKAEEDRRPIRTLCHSFDEILDGGIPLCTISEVCGVSGTGKTQLCLQLAVNVQVPKALGGIAGEALFIDADNGFDVDRMTQVAAAAVEHFQEVAAFENNPTCLGEVGSFSVDRILQRIHYVRCDDRAQLSAAVNLLEDFLTEHEMVRLVIVDTVAFHMREETDRRYAERTAFLFHMSQRLGRIAMRHSLAVVLTNQMTTRMSAADDGSYLVPALGDSWSHACPIRLLLRNEDDRRTAEILKSSHLPRRMATFRISSVGLRDAIKQTVETSRIGCKRPTIGNSSSSSSESKRPRLDDTR